MVVLITNWITMTKSEKMIAWSLTDKKSAFCLNATKQELALILLQLYMRHEGLFFHELGEAMKELQQFVNDQK